MGIRVVPNETVPATVYKHLLPHERQVITVRFHPAVLIRPVAETLGGLAVAGLLATGVWSKSVAMLPLTKVTDMRFERSARGRVFGYGKFVVESAGQEQALREVDYLPYPEQLYLEVCGLIFTPDKGDTDD